jgi:hypothetical protein
MRQVVPVRGSQLTRRVVRRRHALRPKMSTQFDKSSELSALIRARDEISKEDQARWLAVVELSLFLTLQASLWRGFFSTEKDAPLTVRASGRCR